MKRFKTKVVSSLLVIFSLTGCSGFNVNAFSPTPTSTAMATVIPSPVPSATPVIGRVTLVAPPEIKPEEVKAVTDVIQPAISQAGLVLETLGQIPAGPLGPNRVAAIFLTMPANLVDILVANPQTQVIVVSSTDLQTGPTLTVLRVHPEFLAFMAGYTAALVSPNWRAAGLIPDDGDEVNILANSFMSGGRYLCGRCGAATPPFAPYPLTETAPSNSTAIEWQTAATNILPAGLETLYLSKEAQSPELVQSLASQNLLYIGTSFPGDAIKERWAVTLSQDIVGSLAQVMPEVLNGQGGKTVPVGIKLTDINEAIITSGKLRLITETNDGLMKGWINPFTVTN